MSWLPCNLFNLISTTTVFILFKGWLFRQWKILTDGTPCAVKVACTVWSGGKARDDIRGLPITIELGFHLYAQPGIRWPADPGKAAEHFTDPAVLCDKQQWRWGAFVLWKRHYPVCGQVPEEQAVSVINDPSGRDGRTGIGGKTMHVLAYFLTFTAGMVCGLVLTCIVQAGKKWRR